MDDGECETETLESDITVTSSEKPIMVPSFSFLTRNSETTGKDESIVADTSDGFVDEKCDTEPI